MTSKTRGISLIALCAAFVGTAAIASADGWRGDRQDVRQIHRTEAQIGRLRAEERFDVRHDRFFRAGEVRAEIRADKAIIRADKRDLRCR